MRTYDIINAGPRNRFTANGRVVSNSGRVFQPQNLMRHTRWHGLDGDALTTAIETDVQSVVNGSASIVDSNVMDLLGNLVRGVIKAPEGRKLCIADLSNIEGRTLVWLADEEWKVQYFRDFDSGKVRYDNYVMAYAKAMNVDPASVGRYERQIGKVMELACFAADTKVLTQKGWVQIADITQEHRLWDGNQWVEHQGVLHQGVKEVINLSGIEVTADHLIKTGPTWKQAGLLASNESMLSLALETGSEALQSLASTLGQQEGVTASTSNATAALNPTRFSLKSGNSKPVYDIANAGPNNRYVILTDDGPMVAHNCGYGGGVSAYSTFAEVYGLDLTELAKAVWDSAPPVAMKRCEDKHEWAKENGYHAGLAPFEYAACEYLKQQWRDAHPKTVQFWRDLELAFRHCIEYDNTTVHVGRLAFRRQGHWLYVRLPSGRCLVYLQPKIQDGNCSFIGPDPYTKQIKRLKTYSGRLSENVASATARDIMFHRMPDVEAAGYQIILRVHDELVTEVPDEPQYTGAGLAQLMTLPHPWTDGLPLAADGFETYRYREG